MSSRDSLDDGWIECLVLVDGDVPEVDHLPESIGEVGADHAMALEDGEERRDRIRQAVLLGGDHMGGQIDRGLNRALQIEHDDVLHLDGEERLATLAAGEGDALEAPIDRRDLRGDDVTIHHDAPGPAGPARPRA